HTRSKRDWSSDVCSSDLKAIALVTHFRFAEDEIERDRLRTIVGEGPHHASEYRTGPGPATEGGEAPFIDRHDRYLMARIVRTTRSEERRVGKEGISRGLA